MKIHVESEGALSTSIPASGGRAPLVRGNGDVMLDLALEPQRKGRWCWAAIGSALAGYFGEKALSQEDVAALIVIPAGADDDVNLPLDAVLEALGCHGHWSPGKPTFERIAFEIGRGLPLAARVEWLRGDAHFVLVTGYNAGRRELLVEDSLHGRSRRTYADFPRTYGESGGVWTETFWMDHSGIR